MPAPADFHFLRSSFFPICIKLNGPLDLIPLLFSKSHRHEREKSSLCGPAIIMVAQSYIMPPSLSLSHSLFHLLSTQCCIERGLQSLHRGKQFRFVRQPCRQNGLRRPDGRRPLTRTAARRIKRKRERAYFILDSVDDGGRGSEIIPPRSEGASGRTCRLGAHVNTEHEWQTIRHVSGTGPVSERNPLCIST